MVKKKDGEWSLYMCVFLRTRKARSMLRGEIETQIPFGIGEEYIFGAALRQDMKTWTMVHKSCTTILWKTLAAGGSI